MCISVGAKISIMHPVTCFLKLGDQPNLVLIVFMRNDWISKVFKEVQPSLLSALKGLLETRISIIVLVRIGDLLTSLLLTVVKRLALDVLQGTAFFHEHILALVPVEKNVAV